MAKQVDNKILVLENSQGQVVRTFGVVPEDFYVIYRKDTFRLEVSENTKDLENNKIDFEIIKKAKKDSLKKTPFKISNFGTLKFIDIETQSLTPSVIHSEDDKKPLFVSLKWISSATAVGMVLLFLVSFFFKTNQEIELKTVEVFERPEELKPQRKQVQQPSRIKPKVVKASTKPNRKTPQMARTPTPRKAQKVTQKEMSLNQVGALGALGSLNKSSQRGGLNLDNVQTSKGIGRGGSEGSGGMQTSLYGKGLVSAPLGEGQRADGAGGYGNKGKGGGQAGYGRISLVGSGGSFFQPVRSETLVEGGLDRNEIAAVIERHIGQIRYCYEQGLQQDPDLSGRVSMNFSIGADGYVRTANISNSSLGSKQVEGCITNRLKSWKFPKPRGGVIVKVSYPFVLKRVGNS